ncbi:Late competence protein ComGF, access of DNA to ComEA [Staphylococcus petrasii]|uniref:type IV pilus minor pilin ComGF family protein n=1 Tax=Staphylococcus petrasii TaxID=1276936 RepID=UPI000DFC777D|nr:Late competence protein ComGF, access of DNA to ComEA [Staphylococcus petrasii]
MLKRIKCALNINLKAFTFIEMLLSLLVTLLVLSLIPQILKLTQFYLHESYENNQTEYAFFQSDLSHLSNNSHTSFQIINRNTILVHEKEEKSYIKFKNSKLIYENKGRGNITLLNNVIDFKANSINSKIIKVTLKIGDEKVNYEKEFYI